MEGLPSKETENSIYSPEWFKNRALGSLKKIEEGVWDYSDSLLLYVPSAVEDYESMQEEGTPYNELVTKPERKYLADIAKDIAQELPQEFEYIDLGPGTEHKEQFLFDALHAEGKKFTYVPVDISEHFLKLAETHAEQQGIETKPLLASFEEVAAKLGEVSKQRFVSLGLTFSNYAPEEILKLLSSIAGKGGSIFINSQMRDRIDMSKLQEAYQGDIKSIVDTKVALLGLNPATDVASQEVDGGVRYWCTIQNTNPELEAKGIKNGDKLLMFQSLRYTKDTLEGEVSSEFKKYKLFDTNTSFVGTLIWND